MGDSTSHPDSVGSSESRAYSLEELLAAASEELGEEISQRTVRLYATQGLIDRPGKDGRSAIYERRQLLQLVLIRSLAKRGLSLSAIYPLANCSDDELVLQLANLEGTTEKLLKESIPFKEKMSNVALDYLKKIKESSTSIKRQSIDNEVEASHSPSQSLLPQLGAPLSSISSVASKISSRSSRTRLASSRWNRFTLAPGIELHINDSVSIPPPGNRRLSWLQRLTDRLTEQLDERKH